MDIVVGTSIGAVRSLAYEDFHLTSDAHGDICYILDEMLIMQAFLKGRQKRAPVDDDDPQLQEWMKMVRDLAYDIEDYVGDIRYRLSGEPIGRGTLVHLRRACYLLTTMYARHCITTEIRNLKVRLVELTNRYLLNFRVEGVTERLPPPLAPPPQVVRSWAPVGLENAMKEFEPWFTDRNQSTAGQIRLLGITGPVGVGKTTLAKALYSKFQDEFDYRATVVTSSNFSLTTLLRSLIKQFHEKQSGTSKNDLDGFDEWGVEQLTLKLTNQLREKRYLILVEDLWSISTCEALQSSLPKNEKGGTILITTRCKAVAAVCNCELGHVYEHKPLLERDSYNLFLQIISSSAGDDLCSARPINVGIIMNICGGLPLSILLVAGLVASKLRSEPDSNLDYHLAQAGEDLNRALGDNITSEGVARILNYCYNHLSPDLKICLLCLSLFPYGCLISRKSLIRMWIAEGFIIENHGKTVNEVAEDCFDELISRNLIQPVGYNKTSGRVKSCQIHGMVFEYVLAKSRDDNFTSVIGGHQERPLQRNKVRRLSIQGCDRTDKETLEMIELSHVRSLKAFGTSMVLQSTILKCQRLQMLVLENCRGLSYNWLRQICSLHRLKYLSLHGTDIELIPIEVGMLKYLEVLDIRETNVRKLPASVRSLQRMGHLLAGNKSRRIALMMTEEITKLTALQTLSVVSSALPLCGLEHLRVLAIIWSLHQSTDATYQEALVSCLDKWRKLESLTIHCEAGFSMEFLDLVSKPPEKLEKFKVTAGKFVRFPQWINGLKHLAFLQITVCKLDPLHVNILKDLPKLQCLVLGLDFIPIEEIVIQSEGFSKLLRFFFDCPVPWLTFRTGAMPKLTYLYLKFCSGPAREDTVPSGISKLQRLSEVVLCYNQKWCANNSSVNMTVKAVKQEVIKHQSPVDLYINGTIHRVQDAAMEWPTENHSETEDDVKDGDQACAEEIRRITSEIQEIEDDTQAGPKSKNL